MSLRNLLEDYKKTISNAGQHNPETANRILIEILEELVDNNSIEESPEDPHDMNDIYARLGALENKQRAFAAFDPDGDGKPGGSRRGRPPKVKTDEIVDKKEE